MTGLTNRQADCLSAIRDLTFDGVSPTVRELQQVLGLSTSGVARLLKALKARGKIDWRPRQARSLVVLEDRVSPAVLHGLSDEALRNLIASGQRILAKRSAEAVR